MPKFSNTIGYLIELKNNIKQNWFDSVVEYTLKNEAAEIDEAFKEALFQEVVAAEVYEAKILTYEVATDNGDSSFPSETLLALRKFDNFKKLKSYLEVPLHPKATVIFGANGAGKSSLCAALKCLAGSNLSESLCNVYNQTSPCAFEYETKNAIKKWESSSPNPFLMSHIKFFDSKLALSYIDSKSDPKKYIEIAPYLLYLFEILKNHLDEIETFFVQKLNAEEKNKNILITRCQSIFSTLDSSQAKLFRDALSNEAVESILSYMTTIVSETIVERLDRAKATQKQYLTALDINGQKLLEFKILNVNNFIKKLKQVRDEIIKLDISSFLQQLTILNEKQQEQQNLISRIVPSNKNVNDFKNFLDASRRIFRYDGTEKICPFCQKEFAEKELNLIREYANFLTSALEEEINNLRSATGSTIREISAVKNQSKDCILAEKDIPDVLREKISTITSALFSHIDDFLISPSNETGKIFFDFLADCENLIEELEKFIAADIALFNAATGSVEEQNKRIVELQKAVDDLMLEEVFIANQELIKATLAEIATYKQHSECVRKANLPNIKRQLSNKSKQAHTDLIVPKFKEMLDAEYKRIAERSMAAFGIEFASKATEVDVSLIPKVQSKKIDIILSEGELKVYALALFFAELEHCQEDIIIFDDPINSLDDKYSLAVGHRIRDCVKENSEKQIIILTHSYSFFVQILQIFHKSSIGNNFSSLILENCSIVEPHVEKINDLEAKIENDLLVTPFDENIKTAIAKNIRLYIEAVINTYVFNSCRKSYQSAPTVTEFHKYTCVVPLTNEEAVKLSDTYRMVSPWEHDDERTWYLNSDKSAFENRFQTVKNIKAALEARR